MRPVVAVGRLISIEGVDGAGKTTLVNGLTERLTQRGLTVRALREPGGVGVAERIRTLVRDPELTLGPRAEALLYAAARAQLVEEALTGALQAGTWVVLDRFVDSSLAYQGAGRALGIDAVRELNRFATGGLTPDLTLLLDLDPSAARARACARAGAPDRLEREGLEFFSRIRNAYLKLAAAEPQRIHVIDATQPADAVLSAAFAALDELLLPT